MWIPATNLCLQASYGSGEQWIKSAAWLSGVHISAAYHIDVQKRSITTAELFSGVAGLGMISIIVDIAHLKFTVTVGVTVGVTVEVGHSLGHTSNQIQVRVSVRIKVTFN